MKKKRFAVSVWILLCLAGLAFMAPVLANERPLLVYFNGRAYFPMLRDHAENIFTGQLPTTADFTDPFVRQSIKQDGFIIDAPIRFGYSTINYATANPSRPSLTNWLGTDDMGRDVLARLLYGLRVSLLFGVILTALSSAIGIFAGAAQGYFGGKVDLLTQRFIEVYTGMPQLFVLIIVYSMIRPSFGTLLAVMLLFSWTSLVPVVRAEFLKVRKMEYITAARAMGVSDFSIMTRHILPNACVAAMAYMPFILCGGITALAALDFLGFGLPPGQPSLGDMIKQGKDNLHAPWIGLSVFGVLSLLLSSLVFIGDGLRTRLDPRRRQ
ncbi:MAG: ABC transporter permease [Alphaproteobacteria bacterium]|nr:ABC transporter permease [Alphaproteobacteria bacterium]